MGTTNDLPGTGDPGEDRPADDLVPNDPWVEALRRAFVPDPGTAASADGARAQDGDLDPTRGEAVPSREAGLLSRDPSRLAPGEISGDVEARALLADLGAALVESEGGTLSPAVKAQALAAWSAGRPILRAVRPARARLPLAAAASVLALVGGGLLLLGGRAEAAPTLRIERVLRQEERSGGAFVRWEPGRAAVPGDSFRAESGESLSLSLEGGGRVLLPAGSSASVVRGPDGTGALRLDVGSAVLAPEDRPVSLVLDPIRRVLAVERGQARVDVTDATSDERVRVRVDAEGAAVLAGGGERSVLGPGTESAWPAGRVGPASGEIPDALPRETPARVAAGTAGADGVRVAGRLWRVVEGRATRSRGNPRWDASEGTSAGIVRLGWTPLGSVRASRVLRVLVRGPQGTEVRLEGTPVHAVLGVAVRGAAVPGGGDVGFVDLVLPEGVALPPGEVVLGFVPPAPRGSARSGPGEGTIRFEGVVWKRTRDAAPVGDGGAR